MFDQMWTTNLGFIIEDSGKDWNLDESVRGFITSMYVFGMFCGCYAWGVLGDKFGRMFAFKKTVLVAALASLGLTFSVNFEMMMVFLFILGFGMGGELAVGGTVYSEFCPPSKAWTLTILATCWAFGGVVSALIALIIAETNTTSINDWRFQAGVSCVLEFFFFLIRQILDETPSYYLSKGQVDKTNEVLQKIARQNNRVEQSPTNDLQLLDRTTPETEETPENQEESAFEMMKKLFGPRFIKTTLMFTIIYFGSIYSYTGITVFMPDLLENSGNNLSGNKSLAGVVLLQQGCGIPAILLSAWLVETRLGRRMTVALPFVFAAGCTFLFEIAFNLASVRFI